MKTTLTLLAVSASLLISSCTTCPFAPKRAGNVEHVVLVWLKKPGNAADRAAVIAAAKRLQAEIPEARNLTVGTAVASPRPVVDSSFDVGVVIRFADKAAMARYENSPVHQKAVAETLKPLAKRLQVYDIEAN